MLQEPSKHIVYAVLNIPVALLDSIMQHNMTDMPSLFVFVCITSSKSISHTSSAQAGKRNCSSKPALGLWGCHCMSCLTEIAMFAVRQLVCLDFSAHVDVLLSGLLSFQLCREASLPVAAALLEVHS